RGHRVTVVDRLYFGDTLGRARERHGEKLQIARADVRSFDRALLKSVDAVVDLSGISNDPSCELEPDLTNSVNVEGAKRLAVAALEHGEGLALTEASVRHPVSLYARAKAEVEDFLFDLGKSRGERRAMTVTCLRLATVFGLSPRMRFDLAINVMTKNAYVHRRIMVDGGGRQWRPFVHVGDVARAFELAMTSEASKVAGEVFNVGSDASNVQILNLAFRVRDAVPGTEVVHAPTDPDLRDYNVAFEKVQRVLAFKAEKSIDDGIREVLGALRDGLVDPEERRHYTLRQYMFLREAERAHRELSIEGTLLTHASHASHAPRASGRQGSREA